MNLLSSPIPQCQVVNRKTTRVHADRVKSWSSLRIDWEVMEGLGRSWKDSSWQMTFQVKSYGRGCWGGGLKDLNIRPSPIWDLGPRLELDNSQQLSPAPVPSIPTFQLKQKVLFEAIFKQILCSMTHCYELSCLYKDQGTRGSAKIWVIKDAICSRRASRVRSLARVTLWISFFWAMITFEPGRAMWASSSLTAREVK